MGRARGDESDGDGRFLTRLSARFGMTKFKLWSSFESWSEDLQYQSLQVFFKSKILCHSERGRRPGEEPAVRS